ncbi:hypothetical protein HDU92_000322 [Lobulomyces angularis]|nr:hypothetical protein HDU92_000322 [Lobulomyces angularis]
MTCFLCRKVGHSIKDCQLEKNNGKEKNKLVSEKPLAENPYPFAQCFICKKQGHISGACPENEHGLYPNGGNCKYCGSVRHLAKDCKPDKDAIELGTIDATQGGDDDDMSLRLKKIESEKKLKEEKIKKVKKKVKKTSAMSSQQDPVVVSQASADEFEFLDDWPGFVHLPAQDDQAPSPPRKNNQPASDSPKQVFHNYPDCDKSWLSFVVDEVKGTDLADEHCQEVEVLLDSCPPSFMDNSFDSFSSSEDSSRSCSPTSPIISDCNEFSNG